MIDISSKNILIDNFTSLKETSYDKTNSEYMTESQFQVVDFDKVKDVYTFKVSGLSSKKLRSNDALVILSEGEKNKFIFIEFKNGKITAEKKLEHEKIRNKISDSLWILNDLLEENLAFDKNNINYILVYNKSKNSNYSIKSCMAKKSGKSFLIPGYAKYNIFFHNVETVDNEDFKKIVSDLENFSYVF